MTWRIGSDALARPRGVAEPIFVTVCRLFERLEFRVPYRIRGVQSFGDKWAFRRISNAPRREGVRSSNEKLVPLLGLIAPSNCAENMRPGQGGGAREIRTHHTELASTARFTRRSSIQTPEPVAARLSWREAAKS